mgnify:CR=1 FL=1
MEKLKAEKIRLLQSNNSHSVVELELSEGKNREVRRLFETQGFTVTRLQRTQIGRIKLPANVEAVAAAAIRMGFLELPVTAAHAAGICRLPLHHRDPFDRLLIAQALHEPARFLTADRALARYSDLVDVLA